MSSRAKRAEAKVASQERLREGRQARNRNESRQRYRDHEKARLAINPSEKGRKDRNADGYGNVQRQANPEQAGDFFLLDALPLKDRLSQTQLAKEL